MNQHGKKTIICIVLLLLLLSVACRSAPTSTATPTATTPSPIESPTTPTTIPTLADLPQTWNKMDPKGDTRCAHNTDYAYWARPGSRNDVVVYFEGGGGCYDATTCNQGGYKNHVSDNDNPANTIGGIFDLDNPENSFRDYTMLFVPYCTGDVHIGDQQKTYTLPNGDTFDIYHRGYVNTTAALDWVYTHVTNPDSIFVTGCSAGSVASILHTPHIIEHYPQTAVIQLGDSGGGLTSYIDWNIDNDYNAGPNLPDWIPAMQEIATAFTVSKYTTAVANHYPQHTFAQYNPANDGTQRRYYVADGGQVDAFADALQASLNQIHQNSDNFYTYTAPGEHHCVLKHTQFYTEETNGIRLRDWVSNLANQQAVNSIKLGQP